ncbi:MAG: hypothetical protein COB66_07475, partial [Coxiella sp. (in: Bacteria)]
MKQKINTNTNLLRLLGVTIVLNSVLLAFLIVFFMISFQFVWNDYSHFQTLTKQKEAVLQMNTALQVLQNDVQSIVRGNTHKKINEALVKNKELLDYWDDYVDISKESESDIDLSYIQEYEPMVANYRHAVTQTLLSYRQGKTAVANALYKSSVVHNFRRINYFIRDSLAEKTLAAQLYAEFKDFFPHNAVEYFVSYYDYY